jgi:hypothetical protein
VTVAQFFQENGVFWVFKVSLPEKKAVVTSLECPPQVWIDAKGNQRDIDHPAGEIVKVRSEIESASLWMLIIRLTDFGATLSCECWNEHTIIVDKLKSRAHNQNITVL